MIWKTEHLVCTQCRMGRGVPVERGRLGLLQSWVFLVRFHLPSLILALSRRETSARRCRQTKMAITATKASPHPTWRNCMLRPPRNSHITACCYIQRMQKHPHTQQHHGHNNKPDAQQTKRQPSVLRTYLKKKKKKKTLGKFPRDVLLSLLLFTNFHNTVLIRRERKRWTSCIPVFAKVLVILHHE